MSQKALNMSDICIGFNGVPVLKNVNFALDKGEVCGLVGKNGAGKTTTMKTILGLEKADAGLKTYIDNLTETSKKLDKDLIFVWNFHNHVICIVITQTINCGKNIYQIITRKV